MASGAQGGLLRLRLPLPLRRGRPRSRLGTRSRGPERLYGRTLRVSHHAGDRRTPRLKRQGVCFTHRVVRSTYSFRRTWLLRWRVRLGAAGSSHAERTSRLVAEPVLLWATLTEVGPGWLHLRDEALAWRCSRWRSDWRCVAVTILPGAATPAVNSTSTVL